MAIFRHIFHVFVNKRFVLWCQTNPITGPYGMGVSFDGQWELSGKGKLLLVRRNLIDLDISIHAKRGILRDEMTEMRD